MQLSDWFDQAQREVPRYAPTLPLPAYAHRLGVTPHPRKHPEGHSCGAAEFCADEGLHSDNWRRCLLYLWGVDLFNRGYWWEAHEVWEALWKCSAPLVGVYLQGLIQIGAACLKAEAGNPVGTERLVGKGRQRLERVCRAEPVYMGLDLTVLLPQLDWPFKGSSLQRYPLLFLAV